jgi:type VI secretion system protein ImpF
MSQDEHTDIRSARDRLQPALLDRLTDNEPDKKSEAAGQRAIGATQLRAIVLRDLAWLLNCTNAEAETDFSAFPEARQSVINFGLRALSGNLVSEIEWADLEQSLHRAISTFEPRIIRDTLVVKAMMVKTSETHNVVSFEIRGMLWAQPYPLELLLRSNLDLESGQVALIEQRLN